MAVILGIHSGQSVVKKTAGVGATWLAQSTECATLDLRVVSPSATLSLVLSLKQNKTKKP